MRTRRKAVLSCTALPRRADVVSKAEIIRPFLYRRSVFSRTWKRAHALHGRSGCRFTLFSEPDHFPVQAARFVSKCPGRHFNTQRSFIAAQLSIFAPTVIIRYLTNVLCPQPISSSAGFWCVILLGCCPFLILIFAYSLLSRSCRSSSQRALFVQVDRGSRRRGVVIGQYDVVSARVVESVDVDAHFRCFPIVSSRFSSSSSLSVSSSRTFKYRVCLDH